MIRSRTAKKKGVFHIAPGQQGWLIEPCLHYPRPATKVLSKVAMAESLGTLVIAWRKEQKPSWTGTGSSPHGSGRDRETGDVRQGL